MKEGPAGIPYFREQIQRQTRPAGSDDDLKALARGPVEIPIGHYYYDRCQWPEAEVAYRVALTNSRDAGYLLRLRLGKCQLKQGLFGEAINTFSTAASIKPDDPDPVCGLADALMAEKRYEDVQVVLDRARGKDPAGREPAALMCRRAQALQSLGQTEPARKMAAKAAALDNGGGSGLDLARCFLTIGDYKRAEERCVNFVKGPSVAGDDLADARTVLAVCYSKLGKVQQAQEQARLAREAQPTSPQLDSYVALARETQSTFPEMLSTIVQVAAGGDHTVALKSDNTVWAWGCNDDGQLGDGTTTSRLTPAQVSGLTGVTAIAAGKDHTVALKSDGTVWAWGHNNDGELGDGTTTSRSTPVQVSGVTGVTAISVGYGHTVALKSDGTVWAWGYNYNGQLGDGTTTCKLTPAQVSGLTEIAAIAAGGDHTVALKSDGTVWAWGYNDYGELGDGATASRSTPVQVDGLTGVTAIAAGSYHTVALKSDGTVCSWGANGYGELGDGATASRSTLGQVSSLADATMAIRLIPVPAFNLTGATAIAAGYEHAAAVQSDGTVWAWGRNICGELGDGTTDDHSTPAQVSGLTGVIAIAAGLWHTVALKSDGTVWAWGWNYYGQLGDGTTTLVSTPVQVSGLTGTIPTDL